MYTGLIYSLERIRRNFISPRAFANISHCIPLISHQEIKPKWLKFTQIPNSAQIGDYSDASTQRHSAASKHFLHYLEAWLISHCGNLTCLK